MASTSRALPRRGRLRLPVSGPQVVFLLVLLAGTALLGNYLFRRFVDDGGEGAAAVQTAQVQPRTLSSTVSATGTVTPTQQVKLTFASAGRIGEVYVKQGDTVEAGQPLARLLTTDLEVKRDQAQSNLQTAQLRLEALLAGPTNSDVAAAQQTVSTAQSTLTRAQNDLFTLLAGPNADDVAAARTSLERAQTNLQTAQTAYDKLVNGTDLTLRPEYTALQSARSAYQTALSTYNTRTAGPDPLELSTAQASVTSAQASLDSARARLSQTLAGPDPLDLANAQNQVTAAQAALDAARAKLTLVLNPTADAVDLAPLHAAVESARASLDSARARLAQVQQAQGAVEASGAASTRLEQQTTTATSDLLAAQSAVTAAQSQLATAQSNLTKATVAPTPNSTEVLTAQQGVTSAETALRNAQNSLQKLQQGATASDIAAAQQAVTAAESQLRTAQNNVNKLLAGPDPNDVAAAQATLDNARSALETAQTNWDRLTSLSDLTTRTEYTQLMTAREAYQTALTNYNTKTAGPKEGDVAAAQAAVDAANASINAALARLAQVLGGSLPTDIGIARESVATAELALKQAQTDLDNATLKAPFAGTVVSLGANAGEALAANTAAVTLLDPNRMRIDASVDESAVARLKPGQSVNVTFDSLQGRQFQGTVAVVTPSGVTQQGVVTFPVQIVFNAQGVTIPAGATATLRVVTESRQNVLAVPSRAVQRQAGSSVVQVLEDGEPVARTVRTGITADNFTEITEGLQEGETVVVQSTQTATTGQQGGTFGTGGLGGTGGPPAGVPAGPR